MLRLSASFLALLAFATPSIGADRSISKLCIEGMACLEHASLPMSISPVAEPRTFTWVTPTTPSTWFLGTIRGGSDEVALAPARVGLDLRVTFQSGSRRAES